MSDLSDFHRAFSGELLEGLNGAVAPWLDDAERAPHMAVYRNNYVLGCADRLAQAYPAIARLVGAKFFQGLAKAYIAKHPPGDARLAVYGGDFADFVEGFEPAAKLPYLSDVARIERAWLNAHYAADTPPMSPAALSGLTPEQIAGLTPGLHGSATLISSDFPALTIWSANRSGGADAQIRLDQGGETALVWRPGREVTTAPLGAGDAAFLGAVGSGATLGEAGTHAMARDDAFDLAAGFGQWLSRGAFGSPHPQE